MSAVDADAVELAAQAARDAGGSWRLFAGTRRKYVSGADSWMDEVFRRWMRDSLPPHVGWGAVEAVAALSRDIAPSVGDHQSKLSYVQGQSSLDRNRLKEARSAFWQAQKGSDPVVRALALNGFGLSCWREGDAACAIQAFRSAARIAPLWASPPVNMGVVFLSRARFAEAVASFANAISLKPSLSYPHFGQAEALVRQRRFTEAREQYELALRRPGLNREQARLARQQLTRLH